MTEEAEPFLNTGVTTADFQMEGKLDKLNDLVNKRDKGTDKVPATFFRKVEVRPSGPPLDLALSLLRWIKIISGENEISDKKQCSSTLLLNSGNVPLPLIKQTNKNHLVN